ncbi:MAG: zinc-binding alcohol dehydrogenase family protein [Rhodoblastus sp.]
MKAAVVTAYGDVPAYRDFAEPTPRADEIVISVEAVAITQLVKAQVAGRHYSMGPGGHPAPFTPGTEGVGRMADGARVYFAFPSYPHGSMAERVAVKRNLCIPVPDGIVSARAAALANPAMSSWAALTFRAHFKEGETIWVLGATGASGALALEIAKARKAGRIVAFGRGGEREGALLARGADQFVQTDDPRLSAEVTALAKTAPPDVVLDYLWGAPATALMSGLLAAHISNPCRWVQIGGVAGDPTSVPAGLLRSGPFMLVGSGLGSVADADLVAAIGEALKVADRLTIDYAAVPLADVASAWDRKERMVLTMT